MITYKTGDIFTEDVQAIVNTVNCVGIMGRGIALQFKNRFPENFKAYASACKHNEVQPGKMFAFGTGLMVNPRYIINFPTKRHWKGKSKIEDIESGLADLITVIKKSNIKSIAIPPLGCGLGGLDWSEVKARIETKLAELADVEILVFEPQGAPAAQQMAKAQKVPDMTPGRAALIELIYRYLSGLLDPFVTLLEVHKLMYFMQEAGEKLKLRYAKATYGPYAENLSHVLVKIEGYYLSGYADGGDDPQKLLHLVPGAYDEATTFLKDHHETKERFERVADLVDGFETPFGLELLSTVHWIVKNEPVQKIEDIIKKTYAWNEHKKQFTARQIELAANVLVKKSWIELS